MGRHKRHPELKRLDGNPGKRVIDDLLIVPEGEPTAPPHLSDDGTACFDMIVGSMPPNLYAAIDTFALTAFAEAFRMPKVAKRGPCHLRGRRLRLASLFTWESDVWGARPPPPPPPSRGS